MHELITQLLRYVRGTWRYRWWMLGVTWLVALVGWTLVARMPDVYRASARVYVDTQSVLRPVLRGLALETGNTQRKLFLMTRTLLRQENIEKVMRMTDLDLQAKTPQDREELVAHIKRRLRFSGTQRANLYTISYSDESPELAKLVVKSLLTIFMESNLGELRKDQDSATQFLEREIADYETRIRDSEEALARFKQRNLNYLSDEAGGYYASLRAGQQRIEKAELDLKVAEDRVKVLRSQLEGETPTFGMGPAPAENIVNTADLDSRAQALRLKLDQMLVRYTDKHPDVIATRRSLAKIESQKAQRVAKARRALQNSPNNFELDQNPVYQRLRLSLSEAEANVAAKKVLLEEYRKKVKSLENAIDKVLQVEAERSQLTRDYHLMKKNQAALASRLESANLARKAETSSDTVQFRVIDPPRVPLKPSGPNRVFYSTGVLLGGLAAGLVLAFLMSQLRPTYDDRQVLNDSIGLPVLGSVNMVWTSDQVRARRVRNLSFVFSVTALMMTFGVVLALYQFNIELLPRLANSLNLS